MQGPLPLLLAPIAAAQLLGATILSWNPLDGSARPRRDCGWQTSTETGFRRETSTRNGFPERNRGSCQGKSVLCRGFRWKRQHRLDFADKTAGRVLGNRFFVDVRPQNLDANRVSPGNVDRDLISSEKPQVAPEQINPVLRFRLETSTQTGFREQNRRSHIWKPILCRRFRLEPLQKRDFAGKHLHGMGLPEETADDAGENRICVEVFNENVNINRTSRTKPQAAFWEIGSLSTFGPKTSTRIGFRRKTSTRIEFPAFPGALEARSRHVSSDACDTCIGLAHLYQLARDDNTCPRHMRRARPASVSAAKDDIREAGGGAKTPANPPKGFSGGGQAFGVARRSFPLAELKNFDLCVPARAARWLGTAPTGISR